MRATTPARQRHQTGDADVAPDDDDVPGVVAASFDAVLAATPGEGDCAADGEDDGCADGVDDADGSGPAADPAAAG